MCNLKKLIGWRDKSRRMLVYATDMAFHHGGDGWVCQRREQRIFSILNLLCHSFTQNSLLLSLPNHYFYEHLLILQYKCTFFFRYPISLI